MKQAALRTFALAMVVLGSFGAVAAPASAQADEHSDAIEECLDSMPVPPPPDFECVNTGDGWEAEYSDMDSSSSSAFGTFLFLAILWSAVPLGIAAFMASNRGEPMGTAVLLTLFLGWIGLAIVYFGQAKTRDAVTGLAARGATRPSPQAGWRPTPPANEPAAPEQRLKRLQRLRDDGLVNDEEYESQRQRILDSI